MIEFLVIDSIPFLTFTNISFTIHKIDLLEHEQFYTKGSFVILHDDLSATVYIRTLCLSIGSVCGPVGPTSKHVEEWRITFPTRIWSTGIQFKNDLVCSNHLSERKQAINQSFDQASQKLVNYQLWSLSDTLEERDSTLPPRSYLPTPPWYVLMISITTIIIVDVYLLTCRLLWRIPDHRSLVEALEWHLE